MLLHLVHDDKVVSRMISLFEEYNPGNNVYICVSRKKKEDLNFLCNDAYIHMAYSEEEKKLPWKDIDKVIIHYYDFHKDLYLFRAALLYGLKQYTLIWFMWGGDIYNHLERKGFILYSENNTYQQIRKVRRCKTLKQIVTNLVKYIFDYIIYLGACYFFKNRVEYIAVSKEEFNCFQQYLSFNRCKGIVNFTYYPIEDTLGGLYSARSTGNSILVGNSASETNNHEYILDLLKDIDYKDANIYIPLNYGGSEEYKALVVEKSKTLHNTFCILDFLPLKEYNKLMTTCSTFLFANFRQEAWGNILIALYLGGKVYISRNSPLALLCEHQGFKIFIIEDIKQTFHIHLSQEEKDNNRRIALNNYSSKVNAVNISNIVQL